MYRHTYEDVMDESGARARENEALAFERAIELLQHGEREGRNSRAWIDAFYFSTQLWTILLEDLIHPENSLPEAFRAQLISIGFWVLKESDAIREGRSDNISGLIEIFEIIKQGLK
jgi:flagellar biosynthesis activator protein FlaF